MATAAPEQGSEPLKYQKWVLKVSIHCEGCKRKVKRVLQSVDGVYTISIDSQLHKVTVTGDVAADTLIKKLEKTGKHAELWPEKDEKKEGKGKKKKNKKKKNKENQNEPKNSEEDNSESGEEEEEEVEQGGGVTVTVQADGKVTENNQPLYRVDVKGNGNEGAVENTNGGKGRKKKKKKGHKANTTTNAGETPVVTPLSMGSAAGLEQIRLSPPRQHFYPYPAYNVPSYGPPVYAASYNTAHPSAAYNTSYQMGPPSPYSYVYYTPSEPLDEIDDAYCEEEEPTGCSIM